MKLVYSCALKHGNNKEKITQSNITTFNRRSGIYNQKTYTQREMRKESEKTQGSLFDNYHKLKKKNITYMEQSQETGEESQNDDRITRK